MSHFPLSDLIPPPDDLLHAAVELRALMALEGLLLLELLGGNPAAHDVLEGIVILHRDLEYAPAAPTAVPQAPKSDRFYRRPRQSPL